MQHRTLGSTGLSVTEVGLGTWQIGADWGDVPEAEGRRAVAAALDADIDFLDTADVYGDGRSEQLIRSVLNEKDTDDVTVVTKVGRRLNPHTAERYTRENLEECIDRSREYLDVETLDLVQLHCPPNDVYYQPSVFEGLDAIKDAGKIAHYGVSVEKVEQALKAIEYPSVETVQIIFNPFRQRPADLFFEEAKKRDVGIIVRVPLASGLLTNTIDADTEFPEDDHRNYNRDGSAFDRGETFAGLPYERALQTVDELDDHVPAGMTMAQLSLRWILDHDAVSTVIPGSTTPEHIRANVEASELPSLSHETTGAIRDIYEDYIYDDIHHRW